ETAELMRSIGIHTKMKVVHLGTDTHRFRPPANKGEAKKAIGFSPEDQIVGYCGRISREKNPITLYRAFAMLTKKRAGLKLLIVGDGPANLKSFLTGRQGIVISGIKGDVVPYLQAMDVYALASLTETTSLSTLEAMACGVPPICTPVGYIKAYIKGGFNGYTFPKGDWYALARIIDRLLSDKSLRERIGVNARETVVKRFSWDQTLKGIMEVLGVY
ncbi:hypothetical protein COV22_00400, partial [Candidatus Woesearchaeota archaeon CG10_big_fil_rev_8_21_14_0_10_47_5]